MKQIICDLLDGKVENHILPFFWQHGEPEETLRKYVKVIQDSGIGAFCIESRPHPDFMGPQWWKDMEIILDEASQRQMKVWILDDAHFPSGYANGALEHADSSLCKQYIMINKSEICGPLPEIKLDVVSMAKSVNFDVPARGTLAEMGIVNNQGRQFDDDRLLAVVASRITEGNAVDDSLLDLTNKIMDGTLYWDVPAGLWRIFVLYYTRNGGGKNSYINMLDAASCQVQIDAVYEPHFEHLKSYFGNTLAGFFSDEPEFGNCLGYNFDESIGRKIMPLPWSSQMEREIKKVLGEEFFRYLPALWYQTGSDSLTANIRYTYMDHATRIMQKNFSDRLGKWCEKHGVSYIGHVVEENNQHARLGNGMGHFFRALHGQHMSGIDDIGNQVIPGGEYSLRMGGMSVEGDGEFYHYVLGKLGSSAAHIDPKKKGRTMCEIFGAYGWNLGVRNMKYLIDHFLVRGVNYYVPHAFSPKEFPDTDCPPHFYAHGHNPQYRHFRKLMEYLNRMCNVLSDGEHVAPAALLYHAEMEWAGDYMLMQKPARELLENQIDFDIIPSEIFSPDHESAASIVKIEKKAKLKVQKEMYSVIIIPYAKFLPRAVIAFIEKAQREGLPVVFIDQLPEGICEESDSKKAQGHLEQLVECNCVPLGEIVRYLQEQYLFEIKSDTVFKMLRYYHYVKGRVHAYLFSNEAMGEAYDGFITVPQKGVLTIYDAMENELYFADYRIENENTVIHVKLKPYQSKLYIFSDFKQKKESAPLSFSSVFKVDKTWTVSYSGATDYPNFRGKEELQSLHSIGRSHPNFSGFIRYENNINIPNMNLEKAILTIDNAFEGVELWINQEHIGMKICPPYEFRIGQFLKPGKNRIQIEVANTLYPEVKSINGAFNPFTYRQIVEEPVGIVGEVRICI